MIVGYSPPSKSDEKKRPKGAIRKPVTDEKLLPLLDEVREIAKTAPDGTYFVHSDEYLEHVAKQRTEADEERDKKTFDDMNEAVMDEAQKANEQGEYNAFLELAPIAVKENLKFQKETIVPGFVNFTSDKDVHLGLYDFTLPAGMYMLKNGEEVNEARIYVISFDTEEMLHLGDGLQYEEEVDEETGETARVYKEPVTFSATVGPIQTKEGEWLTYLEYVAWLTIAVSPDDDTREAVFRSAYSVVEKGEPEQADELPNQDTARPRNRQDPKTKISRLIGKPESNTELYKEMGAALTVASENEKKRGITVEQVVSIEYMGADGIIAEGRERLTQLDRQVHNAIISHYVAGNRVVSLVQICEFVYGHAKPTAEQRRDVEECIDRQMWTKIAIDMTDEAAKHNLKHPELLTNFKLEGQMLAIRKVTARAANGKRIVAYQLMGEPILYTHAKVTGQILTYSAKLLQAPKGMNNTEKTMAIRQTLLEEIRRAKDGKRNKFIKYDMIYESSGQVPTSRTERSRLKKTVGLYLDMFEENGEISGWKEHKEGRKVTGFEVSFPANAKAPGRRKNRKGQPGL